MSQTPAELAIRARPRAVRRFSRKALIGSASVLGCVMFAALAVALQSPRDDANPINELYNVKHKPLAEGLEQLPVSYADLKPKLGPPLPGDLGAAYLSKQEETTPAAVAVPEKPKVLASYKPPTKRSAPPQPVKPLYERPPKKPELFFQLSGNTRGQSSPPPSQYAGLDSTYAPTAAEYPNYPSLGSPPSAFDTNPVSHDPNGQGSKQAFIDRENSDIYNSHNLVSPRSPYQVMAGNLIPASLVTGINSDLPGQVIGQVTENVFDTVTGQHLLIPQGSRLMGRYDSVVAFGQSRALVVWTRLILPNGDSILLDNLPSSDAQGFAGLKDKVDRHTWQFIKGAALSSLLSVGSELASDDGDRLTRALQNAGQDTANIAGQRIIDRNLNVQPTIKIRQGWRFNVIVSRDLVLKPYGD